MLHFHIFVSACSYRFTCLSSKSWGQWVPSLGFKNPWDHNWARWSPPGAGPWPKLMWLTGTWRDRFVKIIRWSASSPFFYTDSCGTPCRRWPKVTGNWNFGDQKPAMDPMGLIKAVCCHFPLPRTKIFGLMSWQCQPHPTTFSIIFCHKSVAWLFCFAHPDSVAWWHCVQVPEWWEDLVETQAPTNISSIPSNQTFFASPNFPKCLEIITTAFPPEQMSFFKRLVG